MRPSDHTLAEARAQHATLQVRLMDLLARITPIDRVLRHRGGLA